MLIPITIFYNYKFFIENIFQNNRFSNKNSDSKEVYLPCGLKPYEQTVGGGNSEISFQTSNNRKTFTLLGTDNQQPHQIEFVIDDKNEISVIEVKTQKLKNRQSQQNTYRNSMLEIEKTYFGNGRNETTWFEGYVLMQKYESVLSKKFPANVLKHIPEELKSISDRTVTQYANEKRIAAGVLTPLDVSRNIT